MLLGTGAREVGLHREVNEVRPAVIVALEAKHLGAACVATRDPERQHHCFGSGVAEAHLLPRRYNLDRGLRGGDLELVIEAERRAHRIEGLMDSLENCDRAMPEDERAPGREVVDVMVSVDVLEIRPGAARHEDRMGFEARPRPTLVTAAHPARF